MMDKEFFDNVAKMPHDQKMQLVQVSIMTILQEGANCDDREEGIEIINTIGKSGIMDVLPEESRIQIQKIIDEVMGYMISPENDPDFVKIAKLFANEGLSVTQTKGRTRHFKHMVTAEHDGVPYSLAIADGRGGYDPKKVAREVFHYRLTLERHHEHVKSVYEFLAKKEELGDIWVMVGGGSQLQVFFGNKNGYLGILYLTLENLKEQDRLTANGYLASVGNTSFTLVVQFEKNNDIFKEMKVPGVTVQQSDYRS